MGRKGRRAPSVGDPNDPSGLLVRMRQYLAALEVKHFAERTVYFRGRQLELFIGWCETRSITRPEQVTKPVLEAYQRHLYYHRKANGKALTHGTQLQRLVSVRAFFKWLARNNLLLWNPASELELPRLPRRLPMDVLTREEVESVLAQPEVFEPVGLRDRAILETLYSTGIRRMELICLSVWDLDVERGTLMIRQGKGHKDRVVPIGERAIRWVQAYFERVRPEWVFPPDCGAMFLTHEGTAIERDTLSRKVRDYVTAAGIAKRGACHLFRHTCATLMLEGGADIRYIQEMLGHAQVSTTEIYTRVSIRKLKAVHTLTHPGAKVDRGERVEGALPPLAASPEGAAEALKAALAAEAEEERDGDDA